MLCELEFNQPSSLPSDSSAANLRAEPQQRRIAHAREDDARCATEPGSVVGAAQGTPRNMDGLQLQFPI